MSTTTMRNAADRFAGGEGRLLNEEWDQGATPHRRILKNVQVAISALCRVRRRADGVRLQHGNGFLKFDDCFFERGYPMFHRIHRAQHLKNLWGQWAGEIDGHDPLRM
jgi:hypothetical protein